MSTTLIPTQLFIGTGLELVQTAEKYVQQSLCKEQQVDCFCTSCRLVKSRQHPSLLWLNPERYYKVQDITSVFDYTTFSLEKDQSYFFVLEKADTFNPATGNRLLKILEEPPAGYHFILLAQNEHALLETIRSRCHITRLTQEQNNEAHHTLLSFFLFPLKRNDPFAFEQFIKQAHLADNQSIELATLLMNQLFDHVKKALTTNDAQVTLYQKQLKLVQEALRKPPQSGSSEIFWKHLYMQFDQLSS